VGADCDDNRADEPFEDPSARAARNPIAELKELKSANGGWKLARKLLTVWLHSTIRVYYWGSKATWTMFTDQCTHGKTPKDQLIRYVKWAKGGWTEELVQHFKNCFEDPAALHDMSLDWSDPRADIDRHQKVCLDLSSFAFSVARTRSWSMIGYQFPPYSYAGILTPVISDKADCIAALKHDSEVLWALERVAPNVPAAQELLADTEDLMCPAVRVTLETFTRERCSDRCIGGRRSLATKLLHLPDMKRV